MRTRNHPMCPQAVSTASWLQIAEYPGGLRKARPQLTRFVDQILVAQSVDRPHRAVRVLMIESNEDGTVGGSHQSLFDIATKMDRRRFEPVVLFNQDNPFVGRLRAEGIEVVLFDEVLSDERKRKQSRFLFAKTRSFVRAVA